MNKFVFILLTALLSGLLAGSISASIFYLYSLNHADHAHQIIPTWMVMLVVTFIFAAVSGIAWTAYLLFYKKELNYSLRKSVFTAAAMGLGLTGLLSAYFMFIV